MGSLQFGQGSFGGFLDTYFPADAEIIDLYSPIVKIFKYISEPDVVSDSEIITLIELESKYKL